MKTTKYGNCLWIGINIFRGSLLLISIIGLVSGILSFIEILNKENQNNLIQIKELEQITNSTKNSLILLEKQLEIIATQHMENSSLKEENEELSAILELNEKQVSALLKKFTNPWDTFRMGMFTGLFSSGIIAAITYFFNKAMDKKDVNYKSKPFRLTCLSKKKN